MSIEVGLILFFAGWGVVDFVSKVGRLAVLWAIKRTSEHK